MYAKYDHWTLLANSLLALDESKRAIRLYAMESRMREALEAEMRRITLEIATWEALHV